MGQLREVRNDVRVGHRVGVSDRARLGALKDPLDRQLHFLATERARDVGDGQDLVGHMAR